MNRAWIIAVAFALSSCSATHGPQAGSQTHFLRACEASCGAPYSCICGVCTLSCKDEASCTEHAIGATCSAGGADGAASCEPEKKLCDLECSRDAQCKSLGADFTCMGRRCRGPAVGGDTAGHGSGGRTGGGTGTGGQAGSGDVCGDWNRSLASFFDSHQDCAVDADCAIAGSCSGGFGFYAVSAPALSEAQALSDSTPAECAVYDGPIYDAKCDAQRCTAVENGNACGMAPVTPGDSICDGSSAIRLAITDTSGGSPMAARYGFTNPHGFRFAIVDGQCRFHAGGDVMRPVRSGTLTVTQAQQLALDIHWQGFRDIAGPAINDGLCKDGSVITIFVPGDSSACSCRCPPAASRVPAITQATAWLQTLSDQGVPLSGPVRALATPDPGPSSGTPSPWPLSPGMTAIAGLIVPANGPIDASSGAFFDAMADIASLRALRDGALAAGTWIQVQNGADPQIYLLYVRDELPAEVENAFTAFMN